MQRDALYLVDIVEAVRQIGAWLDGVSAADWNADHMLRSSVMWQIVTIGEASSAMSEATRLAIPAVPWRQIRRFRNRAVHHYFGTDWDVVYATAKENVPDLEEHVLGYLRDQFPELAKQLDR